jgi:hypothetical protein
VKQIQDIVNRVYKQGLDKDGKPHHDGKLNLGEHEVTEDGPWWGLVRCYLFYLPRLTFYKLLYRITNWRAGFAAQAVKAMDALIKTQQDESDSEAEGDASTCCALLIL